MEAPSPRDLGIVIGRLPPGPRNAVTDVAGVRVGHRTLADGPVQTGVTVVLPHGGNLFRDKPVAAAHVVNGFGKSVGLVQVEELGTIETPIALTNTFSVGTVATALVRWTLRENPDAGRTTSTVNPVAFECNDGYLNDLHAFAVREEHAFEAIAAASEDFARGAVGGGRGMSCYGLKGGIGSASRRVAVGSEEFTVGVLVQTNFGALRDLRVDGRPVGAALRDAAEEPDKGSVIVVIATDLPLDARQLGRLCRRAPVGLHRTGSHMGHGSGEIVLAFTTANRVDHDGRQPFATMRVLHDQRLDGPFRAVAEAVEEAVIDSMLRAEAVTGRDGHRRRALAEFLDRLSGS